MRIRSTHISVTQGAGKNDVDVGPELAKSFLYAGTRVVRVRGAGEGDAIGIVIRTGKSTTLELATLTELAHSRLQHDQRRPRPLDALSQTDGIQVLSRLDAVYWCACRNRGPWVFGQCGAVC
jgi:hypothetical protein